MRREEGTKRAGRQMSVWFSSFQISLLLAAQRRPRPDWGCLPRAGRGVPQCWWGKGQGLAWVLRLLLLRAGTCFWAAVARGQDVKVRSFPQPPAPGPWVHPCCPHAWARVCVQVSRTLEENFGSSWKRHQRNVRKAMQKFIFYFNSKI